MQKFDSCDAQCESKQKCDVCDERSDVRTFVYERKIMFSMIHGVTIKRDV